MKLSFLVSKPPKNNLVRSVSPALKKMKRNYQNMYIIYIIHTCNIENYDGDIVLDDADEEGLGTANDDIVLALPSSWEKNISIFLFCFSSERGWILLYFVKQMVFQCFSLLPSDSMIINKRKTLKSREAPDALEMQNAF